jgi:hypothetical protein
MPNWAIPEWPLHPLSSIYLEIVLYTQHFN